METNKIEKALLDRELKNILESLGKIGSAIIEIFSKYGTIEGDHSKELHDYIVKNVLRVQVKYYAGYTTAPSTYLHPDHIPECVRELVLSWAVKDFMEHLDQVQEVVENAQ